MSKLESLQIEGFKNLNFHAENLKKINYFVGPSGARKSSVWELLHLIAHGNYHNGVNFFGDLNDVIADSAKLVAVANDGVNISSLTFILRAQGEAALQVIASQDNGAVGLPDTQYFTNEIKQHGYGMGKLSLASQYDPTKYSLPMKQALYKIADQYPGVIARMPKLTSVNTATNQTDPIVLGGPDRDMKMSAANLAGGHASLASMAAAIINNLGSMIILEEPDNGMHVDLQKSLHSFIKELTQGNDEVQVMVITHSPFLLSQIDAEDTETNIYMINDGIALRSSGFGADGARYLASKLVGLTFLDMAPSHIIVCEKSLSELLNKINDRFYSSPIMITSAKSHMGGEGSGDMDIMKLTEVFDMYDQRFNFFSKVDLTFILDKFNNVQKREQVKLDKITRDKDTNLIQLDEEKLEDYYVKITSIEGVEKEYINDSHNSKTLRAAKVGELISRDEFESLFPADLVSLFKQS